MMAHLAQDTAVHRYCGLQSCNMYRPTHFYQFWLYVVSPFWILACEAFSYVYYGEGFFRRERGEVVHTLLLLHDLGF